MGNNGLEMLNACVLGHIMSISCCHVETVNS